MANQSTKIRTALHGLIFALAITIGQPALARSSHTNSLGSTDGLLNETPQWGAGVQVADNSVTGISVQKMGVNKGSMNLALGWAFRATSLQGNLVRYFDSGLKFKKMKQKIGYQQYRGDFLFYGGGGAILGNGIALHAPFGAQYTMIADPISFFGDFGITLGPIFGEENRENQIHLAWSAGIRGLL